jgi:putative transposase
VNSRNGYRRREWETRAWHGGAGDPEAAAGVVLPGVAAGAAPPRRARPGHCYRDQLPARRVDAAVEKLAQSLGVTKVSKSQVSVMAAELDEMVTQFRSRPLEEVS